MTKDEAITIARQKMATPVQCQIGGEFYVEMNLRNPRVCQNPDCQNKFRSRPRSVNPNNRQFLTPHEVQQINNNPESVVIRGKLNDVR